MKVRLLSLVALAIAFTATAQDAPTTPTPTQPAGRGQAQGQGRGGGRGGWGGGGGGMMGRGVLGTVTEVAADHYTVKTDAGLTYTIHYSVNTRILKQQPGTGGPGSGNGGQRSEGGGNPPQPIKPTDIKVGDAITAMGEVDANAKSVGAVAVIQLDPERAKQLREMQANYGKTWIAGKVTAIDGVKVTVMGAFDNTTHSFVADENTTFRKRRDPITLGDIQVGDTIRVEGALKDGTFLATTVNAMGQPPVGGPAAAGGPGGPPQ